MKLKARHMVTGDQRTVEQRYRCGVGKIGNVRGCARSGVKSVADASLNVNTVDT